MAQDKRLSFAILAKVAGEQSIKKLRDAVTGVGKAAKDSKSDFDRLKGGLKQLASAYVVNEGIQFAKSLIDTADQLDEVAQKTGVSASELARFKGQVDLAGMPLEGFAKALNKLARAQVEARGGSEEARATFKALGVAYQQANGQLAPTGDVLRGIADRFSKIPDGAEKAALATQLFGKAGADLIPFLNNGGDAIDKFGLKISDDFAARAGAFNDAITQIGVNMKNTLIEGLDGALPAFTEVAQAFRDMPTESEGVVTAFEAIGEVVRVLAIGINAFVTGFQVGMDIIISAATLVANDVAYLFNNLSDSVATSAAQLKSYATLGFAEAAKAQEDFEARQLERQKLHAATSDQINTDLVNRTKKRAQELEQFTNKLGRNSFLGGEGTVDEIRKRQREATAPPARPKPTLGAPDISGAGGGSKLKQELNTARALREAGMQEIEMERLKLEAYRYSTAELQKLTETKRTEIEITKATKNMTAEGAAAYREAAMAVLEQKLALIDLEEQQKRTFTIGIAQGARDYLEKVQDVASQTKDAFTNAFKGLEDGLVEFVKTGKMNFADFADSVISDIIRIAVRQAVIAPLLGGVVSFFNPLSGGGGAAGLAAGGIGAGAFAFANGGIMTARGSMSLKRYAKGGIANSPQLAMFGEGSTPEAYVPLPDGRRIPVAMSGAQGSSVVVNVNIDRSGGEQTSVESDAQSGKQLGVLISNAVKTELINQRRPGGLLA